MGDRLTMVLSGGLTGAVGMVALIWWLRAGPPFEVGVSTPEMDDPLGNRRRDEARRAEQSVDFGGIRGAFDGVPSAIKVAWPRFRGENLDNISPETVRLVDAFGADGPKRLWMIDVGEGYAGPAVHGGRVFLMDYMEQAGGKGGDVLRCFSLDDGREIWRCGYPIYIASNHGVTRTVPAVTDKYIVTMGPMGHVMCVAAETGRALWGLDLSREYGTRNLSKCWYAGQCPVIDNGLAIIAPAGSNVLMMAVSCETGDTVWKAPNPRGWKMSHASITPMTIDGVKTYVYAAVGGVAAVAADGPDAGRLLWETEEWTSSVVMPSPVVLAGNRLFVTSGYDGGSALLEVARGPDGFGVRAIYNYTGRKMARDCFSCYQQTPLYFKGRLFGIQSNDAREHKLEFACVDPAEAGGRFVWTSGTNTVFTAPKKKEAWGPWIMADDKFYVLGDTGLLAVFRASAETCVKLGEWPLFEDGHEVWGPPAIVGGRLLVRDISRLACFDLAAAGN